MKDCLNTKNKIIHCEGALESLNIALERVPQHTKNVQKAKLWRLIERLGNGMQMSNDTFPKEGILPDGTHFRALKKLPIRAYIWLSKSHSNTYFISHYIYKDQKKLSDSDTNRVKNNWFKMERNQ